MQEEADSTREAAGRPVMAGLRSLIIVLCTCQASATLATASRDDMGYPGNPGSGNRHEDPKVTTSLGDLSPALGLGTK